MVGYYGPDAAASDGRTVTTDARNFHFTAAADNP